MPLSSLPSRPAVRPSQIYHIAACSSRRMCLASVCAWQARAARAFTAVLLILSTLLTFMFTLQCNTESSSVHGEGQAHVWWKAQNWWSYCNDIYQ